MSNDADEGPAELSRVPDAPARLERAVVRLAQSLTLIGVVAVLVFAIGDSVWSRVFSTGVVLLFAAAACGALVGFLFALPREAAVVSADAPQLRYLSNSNLLKVSDWLTTIIVGLALVNIRSVGAVFGDLANALDDSLGGESESAAFARSRWSSSDS